MYWQLKIRHAYTRPYYTWILCVYIYFWANMYVYIYKRSKWVPALVCVWTLWLWLRKSLGDGQELPFLICFSLAQRQSRITCRYRRLGESIDIQCKTYLLLLFIPQRESIRRKSPRKKRLKQFENIRYHVYITCYNCHRYNASYIVYGFCC